MECHGEVLYGVVVTGEMVLNKSRKDYLITVDGPAASGKSSLSRFLAGKLGWKWLSTGVFYRGVAYLALSKGLKEEKEIVALI